jgi:Family of unknown function (DUF5706)
MDELTPLEDKPKKPKKKKEGSRSIETMFRTTLSNHVQLSSMADRKAGLMISVNSILISIMVSFMVHEFATNPKLILPTALLVLVCLLTIIFSILATKPSVNTRSEVETDNVDLQFFGHYTHLSLDDYKTAVQNLMTDEAAIRNQMITNIYAQGNVLNRKYKLLQIAYNIFLFGFPLAVLTYLLVLAGLL